MDESHTGANMCEFLKAMADKWGTEKHVLVLVTDKTWHDMSLAAELGNFLLTVKDYKVKNNNFDITVTLYNVEGAMRCCSEEK